MINSVSHDSVCRLGADRPMCFATALDKAFENIDCMSAILRCQAKNHIYESTQRLIKPRRVLWRFLFFVAAIFIAVFVFDADFHAAPGSVFIGVTPVAPISVRTVPV